MYTCAYAYIYTYIHIHHKHTHTYIYNNYNKIIIILVNFRLVVNFSMDFIGSETIKETLPKFIICSIIYLIQKKDFVHDTLLSKSKAFPLSVVSTCLMLGS